MSSQERGYFTILKQISETSLKIQENVSGSVEEVIEIDQSGSAKTKEGIPIILIKTTQGRQFIRLPEWPKNLLMEITKS